MNVVIIGIGSDIGLELAHRFVDAGHRVFGSYHTDSDAIAALRGCIQAQALFRCDISNVSDISYAAKALPQWDVLIFATGLLEPIGTFAEVGFCDWLNACDVNCLGPLEMLHKLYPKRNPNATVVFFSGAGVSRPANTYSAYSASKIMLMKMTELLDDEMADCKHVILGPGMVRTKIQQQTLNAGSRAANYERVRKFMEEGDDDHAKGTSHDRIYSCVKWCIEQPKEVVGGRNFYIPSDKWGDALAPHLRENKCIYKLRRFGGGF